MSALTAEERAVVADALVAYAEGVQENLADDDMRDHEAELDGEPNERGYYPVVEDYLADADRIRNGETPLHELTREVLRDETSVPALADDEADFAELVEGLLGLAVAVNQHGAVYAGGVATDNVIGWVHSSGCENEACLEAIAAGRPWHAMPRSMPPDYPRLAVYHYSTRVAAVVALLESAGVVRHAADCPVVEQRAALALELAADPDNEVLRGAELELYFGDQDAEACACGAYARLEALDLADVVWIAS